MLNWDSGGTSVFAQLEERCRVLVGGMRKMSNEETFLVFQKLNMFNFCPHSTFYEVNKQYTSLISYWTNDTSCNDLQVTHKHKEWNHTSITIKFAINATSNEQAQWDTPINIVNHFNIGSGSLGKKYSLINESCIP